MKEGGLKAPTRHPHGWTEADYIDPAKVDAELRRVFDVCHGCRRCFNLCDSFPRLFDLVDESPTGEVDGVPSEAFKSVVDACTLCDMCFMAKCPYVPPHELNIDFPHLMLRHRAMERSQGKQSKIKDQLAKVDRNAKVLSPIAPIANWASRKDSPVRKVMEKAVGIHKDAVIPTYASKTLVRIASETPVIINKEAPGYGRKAVLYATCYGNYNMPELGMKARALLAHNGVETQIVYKGCCGMPKLEQGDLAGVAAAAEEISRSLDAWIDKGYEIVPLVPSCTLMMKMEWPLLLPENPWLRRLSRHVRDLSEYIVELHRGPGLVKGIQTLEEPVTVHLACHGRAQNIGAKAVEMLHLIPGLKLWVIDRCSGHGGTWGMMEETHPVAVKVGKPVVNEIIKREAPIILSECPLAAAHIAQGANEQREGVGYYAIHPIELLYRAYGLGEVLE